MRRFLLLAFVLLCARPAFAQEDPLLTVQFETWPPGAVVLAEVSGQGDVELGLTGRKCSVPRSRVADRNVTFRLAGHKDYVLRVRALDLKAGPDGVIHLPPEPAPLAVENPLVAMTDFVRYRPVPAGLLLMALVGGALFALRTRSRTQAQLTRGRQLETMQARADDTWPLIGKTLGRYRIVDRLGRGGMATVYRGVLDEDPSSMPVAVKVMSRDVAEDEEFRKRFLREVRVSQQVEHPGIVHVVDSGEQEGLLFLVMELVPGVPMREMVREGGRPVKEVLDLARPMMSALQAAHDKHIVHRDLKPDNMMVLGPTKVKLMDFGLARAQEFSTLTVSGTALGTPAYMAPELIQHGSTSSTVDQYAMGVVLFELLTGRRPFEDQDAMSLIFKHLTEEAPSPREFRPDLPEPVAQVVLKMLAKEPGARFATVGEALQALESAAR